MLIKQKFIFRSDLQANPDVLYLFGDNDARIGYGGQAKEMRDEPNAVGIRTKWRPGMSYADFFNDDQYEEVVKMFNEDLTPVWTHIDSGGVVIIPADGLGTGLSKLPELAPMCNQALVNLLAILR
jgi:hypothetical protein